MSLTFKIRSRPSSSHRHTTELGRAKSSESTDLVDYFRDKMARAILGNTPVIPWSCPVPSFGDWSVSVVASLGLNPSNREFVDEVGNELCEHDRRLPTLRSLCLDSWVSAQRNHLATVLDSCRRYFDANPYDLWFKSLDEIVSSTGYSYYGSQSRACHLDIIPFATTCKWTELTRREREELLYAAGDALGLLLNQSPVRILVLNGQSVVSHLAALSNAQFESRCFAAWDLPRASGANVRGVAYKGVVTKVGTVNLDRPISVLGYNHNIQSSFGVTRAVKQSIRDWIGGEARGILK